MMVIAMEIVLFVNNSPLAFEDLEEQVDVNAFNLWKACDSFLKFDKASMPSALRTHLLDIDTSIVSEKVWRDHDSVELIKNFINNERDKDEGRL